jgi:predicted phosphodiesterase
VDKAKAHEVVSDIQRVASLLGHWPSRREYLANGGSHVFEKTFGSWTVALKAAGGEPSPLARGGDKERKAAIKNAFTVPIEKLTARAERKIIELPGQGRKVMAIGDVHTPWHCVETASLIVALAEQTKPTHIVQLGDARDMFAIGNRHPHTRLTYNPKEELDKGTDFLTWFWSALRKASPKAECFQILGNHDARPLKRVLESAPDLEVLLDLSRFYRFDGVNLIEDVREVLKIGNTAHIHGYRKHGDHMNELRCNVIHGHTHGAGVIYKRIAGELLWEADAGTCAMGNSIAMSYTPLKLDKSIQGVILEDDFGPRFIHRA